MDKGVNEMTATDRAATLAALGVSLDTAAARDDCVTVCYGTDSTIVRAYVPVADLLAWERDHIAVPFEVFTEIPPDDEPARLVRAAGWTDAEGGFHYYTTICVPGVIAEALP